MIKFNCHCNHAFEFPDEMAGKQAQCPACGRLVDIPSAHELSHLSEDGTFLINDPVEPKIDAFEEMRRLYTRNKVDESGHDIDLRQTQEQLAAAGTQDDIFEYERLPKAPKYDPETGELIRPLDIAAPAVPLGHAVAAPATGAVTLNYATPDFQEAVSYSPFFRLFAPINLVTMFFVFLLHVFFFMATSLVYVSLLAIAIVGPALIAHYANVVEEIGVEERDDLPRLLRHFEFGDDIFYPFWRVAVAWLICFAPTRILALVWAYHQWPMVGGATVISVMEVLGWILFPAVVLTTTTSGSFADLSPYRVVSVIGKIGPQYALLVILYVVASSFYVVGLLGVPTIAYLFAFTRQKGSFGIIEPIAIGILVVGIFLMHYFAWKLGLCYRRYHRKFPWAYHQEERILPGINAPRHARPLRMMEGSRRRAQRGQS
jgi:hypothetical protein